METFCDGVKIKEESESNTSKINNNRYNLRSKLNPFRALVLSPAVSMVPKQDKVIKKEINIQKRKYERKNGKKTMDKSLDNKKNNKKRINMLKADGVCTKKEELPEFCLTKSGKTMIIFEKYRFTRSYVYPVGVRNRWVCMSQGRMKCKATIYTKDDVIVETHANHSHPP